MQLCFLIACYFNVTTLFLRNSLVFTRLMVVVVECDYTIKEVMQASAIIRSDLVYFFYIFCCPTIHLSMLGIII